MQKLKFLSRLNTHLYTTWKSLEPCIMCTGMTFNLTCFSSHFTPMPNVSPIRTTELTVPHTDTHVLFCSLCVTLWTYNVELFSFSVPLPLNEIRNDTSIYCLNLCCNELADYWWFRIILWILSVTSITQVNNFLHFYE